MNVVRMDLLLPEGENMINAIKAIREITTPQMRLTHARNIVDDMTNRRVSVVMSAEQLGLLVAYSAKNYVHFQMTDVEINPKAEEYNFLTYQE